MRALIILFPQHREKGMDRIVSLIVSACLLLNVRFMVAPMQCSKSFRELQRILLIKRMDALDVIRTDSKCVASSRRAGAKRCGTMTM